MARQESWSHFNNLTGSIEDQEDLSLFIHGMEIMMAHRESEWHFNNLTGGSIDMLKIRMMMPQQSWN